MIKSELLHHNGGTVYFFRMIESKNTVTYWIQYGIECNGHKFWTYENAVKFYNELVQESDIIPLF